MVLDSGPLGASIVLDWTDPDVTDNSALPVTLTSDITKGSLIGPGFHIIRITAKDNEQNTVSCNFIVVVQRK